MTDQGGGVVVIGGTRGLGREVTITGRDQARTEGVARELGGDTRAAALDLRRPREIAAALADVGAVDHLVIAAMERDQNTIREFNIDSALELVTEKLVGYAEVIHTLVGRLHDDSSIVLFGGMAKERPYPGSTTVSTVNGGIVGMVRTLAIELAPIRVNAIHPGIVPETPYWDGKNLDHVLARTPTKRFVTAADIVDGVRFLLENRSVNAFDLRVDGGWIIL
jgi:NAD(P)-dependent dehydrogenase (short-subunit alcohol dehydrogenase family)